MGGSFHNAYYVCISCVLSVHDFDDTYCCRINGVLAKFSLPSRHELFPGRISVVSICCQINLSVREKDIYKE